MPFCTIPTAAAEAEREGGEVEPGEEVGGEAEEGETSGSGPDPLLAVCEVRVDAAAGAAVRR